MREVRQRVVAHTIYPNCSWTDLARLDGYTPSGRDSAGHVKVSSMQRLPVEHPEQLVLLTDTAESGAAVDTTEGGVRDRLSYPEFEQLRLHNRVFSGIFAAQNEVSDVHVFPAARSTPQPVSAHTQLLSAERLPCLSAEKPTCCAARPTSRRSIARTRPISRVLRRCCAT